ncbi:NirD/YgiW/YdeI family stress tolerance protein [Candidatus Sodalis endolongispinus]|uniref:NirD/YgiW/YdeI family stress tolerance protein n=1 Tax=Candidatus Sodalis endolongispinus TaxID=2812662 RepID=A0ABS5YCN4_9GAMM|nr:NirD/YgiW/YdeI family stress tolerance protein [Candidatus Sodalis endolongispinus]MBT9432727.1 NirD/YgiW/YdeI family stress tolerance protein [Candidatus Sodalis endolongispinus]
MKKSTFTLLIALFSPCVLAAPDGGFHPDKAPPPPQKQDSGIRGVEDLRPTAIKQVKTLRDGAWVTLIGNIHRQLGKDSFELHDKTGSLALHIAPDGWRGADISPDDLIIVSGTLHKDPHGETVDVQQLQKQ